MRYLLLIACTALLIRCSLAALLNCDIELCTSIAYTGYCKKWRTTINASPRGDYRVVDDLPAIMAGNVRSFRYICEPDPFDQRLALWRNTFVRMFRDRNYTKANSQINFRKYYYQTGGFPRFVYRNLHPDLTQENNGFEPYYSFAIYYNVHGAFRPALIPPNNPIFPVVDYEYYDDAGYDVELLDDDSQNDTKTGQSEESFDEAVATASNDDDGDDVNATAEDGDVSSPDDPTYYSKYYERGEYKDVYNYYEITASSNGDEGGDDKSDQD